VVSEGFGVNNVRGPDASTSPSTRLRADGWNGMTKGANFFRVFGFWLTRGGFCVVGQSTGVGGGIFEFLGLKGLPVGV
jgi:hypothetical protein